jgi:hypothetical protein
MREPNEILAYYNRESDVKCVKIMKRARIMGSQATFEYAYKVRKNIRARRFQVSRFVGKDLVA